MIIREEKEYEDFILKEGDLAVPLIIKKYGQRDIRIETFDISSDIAEMILDQYPEDPLCTECLEKAGDLLDPVMHKAGFGREKDKGLYCSYILKKPGGQGKESFIDREKRTAYVKRDGIIAAESGICDIENDENVEIYVECDPKYRNRGFGTDCVLTLSSFLFNECGVKAVKYEFTEDNIISKKLAEKAGFSEEYRYYPFVYYRDQD